MNSWSRLLCPILSQLARNGQGIDYTLKCVWRHLKYVLFQPKMMKNHSLAVLGQEGERLWPEHPSYCLIWSNTCSLSASNKQLQLILGNLLHLYLLLCRFPLLLLHCPCLPFLALRQPLGPQKDWTVLQGVLLILPLPSPSSKWPEKYNCIESLEN